MLRISESYSLGSSPESSAHSKTNEFVWLGTLSLCSAMRPESKNGFHARNVPRALLMKMAELLRADAQNR
jgi:hypothetical protein